MYLVSIFPTAIEDLRTQIKVDADACPGEIKELLFRAAKRTKITAIQPGFLNRGLELRLINRPLWSSLRPQPVSTDLTFSAPHAKSNP